MNTLLLYAEEVVMDQLLASPVAMLFKEITDGEAVETVAVRKPLSALLMAAARPVAMEAEELLLVYE